MRNIAIGLTLALALAPSTAPAQTTDYPARTVEIVVPYPAGGQTDLTARTLADALRGELGGTFIVNNKGGGAGLIGMTGVANAAPDGHTLAFTPLGTVTAQPHRQKRPPYTIDSFDPICRVTESVLTLAVKADSPLKSLDDLAAAARREPGKVAIGHIGQGSIPHLYLEHFAQVKGISLLMVAYRGEAQVLPALLGGEIPAGLISESTLPLQPLRGIAAFAAQRSPGAPGVPTFAEGGVPGIGAVPVVLVGPKGIAPTLRARLEQACLTVLGQPLMRDMAAKSSQVLAPAGGAEVAAITKRESALFGGLIERLGLQEN